MHHRRSMKQDTQKDTKTGKKILHSSLCRSVEFTVPTSWGELTQDQLLYVMKAMCLYQDDENGFNTVKCWVLQYFCDFRFVRNAGDGWLCRRSDGSTFLMAHDVLPQVLQPLAWIDHPEEMTDRIESIGVHKATDFLLQGFPFGDYLQTENFYQSYMKTRNGDYLVRMARLLYGVGEAEDFTIPDYLRLSVFLWYTAVKRRFARQFCHFLKPVAEGQSTGESMSQYELVNVQIRLLNRGDITKNEQIMNTTAWDALAELDAQANEAEQLKRKTRLKKQ